MGRVRGGGSDRWKNNAAAASQTYVEGVNNPRKDWATATVEGEKNYNQAIQNSIAQGSFSKGVKKAGSAKQKEGVNTKGAQRYAEGVQLGDANYAAGVAPYIQTLESITLKPRGVKGSPANYDRVKQVCDALIAKRKVIKG